MYLKLNPQLEPSPYLNRTAAPITNDIIRFRLRSHYLPIEVGRWSRIPRDDRKCTFCDKLGDEPHNRNGIVLPDNFHFDWNNAHVLRLFRELRGLIFCDPFLGGLGCLGDSLVYKISAFVCSLSKLRGCMYHMIFCILSLALG